MLSVAAAPSLQVLFNFLSHFLLNDSCSVVPIYCSQYFSIVCRGGVAGAAHLSSINHPPVVIKPGLSLSTLPCYFPSNHSSSVRLLCFISYSTLCNPEFSHQLGSLLSSSYSTLPMLSPHSPPLHYQVTPSTQLLQSRTIHNSAGALQSRSQQTNSHFVSSGHSAGILLSAQGSSKKSDYTTK